MMMHCNYYLFLVCDFLLNLFNFFVNISGCVCWFIIIIIIYFFVCVCVVIIHYSRCYDAGSELGQSCWCNIHDHDSEFLRFN